MKRIVTTMALAGLFWLWWFSGSGGLTGSAETGRADLYSMPAGSTADLVGFIQRLSEYRPSTPQEDVEYRRNFRTALKNAADEVLKLETDPKSEAHQAAKFVLLVNRVHALAQADPRGQTRTIADAMAYLQEQIAAGQGAVGVNLAKSLGEKLELMGEWARAAEVFKSVAETAGKSKEESVTAAVTELKRAAERLAAASSQIDHKVPEFSIPPTGGLVPLDLTGKTNLDIISMSGSGSFPANGLAEVPPGEHTFGGVKFRVGDKVIQLASTNLKDGVAKVEGIAVGRKITRLYVLQGTQWGYAGDVGEGKRIGEYRVNYSDGSAASMPIAFGEDVRDWWNGDRGRPVSRGRVVWTGSNFSADQSQRTLRLYLGVWGNPHPSKEVATIDFVSTNDTACAPFCVAMTVEMLPLEQ